MTHKQSTRHLEGKWLGRAPFPLSAVRLAVLVGGALLGQATWASCTVSGTSMLGRCDASLVEVSLAPGSGTLTVDAVSTQGVYLTTQTPGTYNQTVFLTGNTSINNPSYSGLAMQYGTDSSSPPNRIAVTVNADVKVDANVNITSFDGFGAIWVRNDNAGSVAINNAGTVASSWTTGGIEAAISGVTNLGGVNIVNSGTVTSANGRGIYADGNYRGASDGMRQTVSVTNTASGVVDSLRAGIRVIDYYGLAQLTNAGTVNATLQQGLVAWSADGDALIVNSGRVTSGNDNAIYAMSEIGSASILNSGVVLAAGDASLDAAHAALPGGIQGMNGLRAGAGTSGDVQVTNTASGMVTASRDAGIRAETPQGNATVVNAGTVTGRDGIVVDSGFGTGRTDATVSTIAGSASVTNSGLVSGTDRAVVLDGQTNRLVNTGSLTTSGSAAVVTGNGDTTILNSGRIAAASATETAILLGNGTNRVTLFDGSSISGLVRGGTGRDTLELSLDRASTFDVSQLGGSGQFLGFEALLKSGSGLLELGGTSVFDGETTVAGGELRVNGSLAGSAVTVGSGARLSGSGTVGSLSLQSGATVAPGNSPGTLTVAGNYTQAAGSTYEAELVPGTGTSDRIAVKGSAQIADGAVLHVSRYGSTAPFSLTDRYTVLTADGGVTGRYVLTGDTGISTFYALTTGTDAGSVYVAAQQVRAFTSAALTTNQIATAGALQSLAAGGALRTAIGYLPDDAQARVAFDQLSGEIHASLRGAMVEDSRFVRTAAIDRLRAASGTPAGAGASAGANGLAVWSHVYGTWGKTSGNGNAASLSHDTGGFVGGADLPVFDTARAGVLLGYGHASYDGDGRGASGSSNGYTLGAYGGTQVGGVAVRLGTAYTWSDVSTHRDVVFSGLANGLSAKYDARTFQAFAEAGYRIDAGAVALEPFAGLAHVAVRTDGFTERGGVAALTSGSSNTDVNFSTMGLRGSGEFNLGGRTLTASASLAWRHAFGDTTPQASFRFLGSDAFGVSGVPIAKNAALVEAGVSTQIARNASLRLSYTGQFGSHARSQGLRGNLDFRF